MPDRESRSTDSDPVLKIWEKYRPYWHILSTVAIIIAIFSMKWTKVNGYDDRIIALEVWRIEVSRDLATMGQEVHDIHDQVVPSRR